jgi:nucleoside-diphosphate-sugar epimerase
MNIFVTGEKGFIATNLPRSLKRFDAQLVSLTGTDLHQAPSGEICVWRNSEQAWIEALRSHDVQLIIHNAAVVGTDVVALNVEEATLSNVTGTYNICRAANKLGIPVCYLGTTVIYDTSLYQDKVIKEDSIRGPNTLYGAHKLAGEHIVKSHCDEWLIMRPLFAFGGIGDMNSLIAKSFYAALDDSIDSIDMFLNPNCVKDYLHVEDFCDAVALACYLGLWNKDYNVSAWEPQITRQIVDTMSEVSGLDIEKKLRWYPDTDYLGNHMLTSEKFRTEAGWSPRYSLYEGLKCSWTSIQMGDSEYNPLKHLQEAQRKNIDLTDFF